MDWRSAPEAGVLRRAGSGAKLHNSSVRLSPASVSRRAALALLIVASIFARFRMIDASLSRRFTWRAP